MGRKQLSQWADEQGVARRTAYNWFKKGVLPAPAYRTITGRIMVLDEQEPDQQDAHPFVAAYAEALGVPLANYTGDRNYSPLLEAWGVSLYDAVAVELRPVVLQLTHAAACTRRKTDVLWRFADWVARIELADWLAGAGLARSARMARSKAEITDEESFDASWPTAPASFDWRSELDNTIEVELAEHDLHEVWPPTDAADALGGNGLIALDNLPLTVQREKLRTAVQQLRDTGRSANGTPYALLGAGELWDLRTLYLPATYGLARPAAKRTAVTVCAAADWDPEAPAPPDTHPAWRQSFDACQQAARAALAPYLHAAHMREVDAFRRIALAKPFIPTTP